MREPFANQNNRNDQDSRPTFQFNAMKPKPGAVQNQRPKGSFFNSDVNSAMWKTDASSFAPKDKPQARDQLFKSSSNSLFPEVALRPINMKKEVKALPDGSTRSRTPPKLDKDRLKAPVGLFAGLQLRQSSREVMSPEAGRVRKLVDFQDDIIRELLRTNVKYRVERFNSHEHSETQQALEEMNHVFDLVSLRPETKILANWLIQLMAKHLMAKDKLITSVIACVLVASKVEEYYPPRARELIKLLSRRKAFMGEDIIKDWCVTDYNFQAESKVLIQANFRTITPHLASLAELMLNEAGYEVPEFKRVNLMRRTVQISSVAGIFDSNITAISTAIVLWHFESGSENTNHFPAGSNLNPEQTSFLDVMVPIFERKYQTPITMAEVMVVRKHINSFLKLESQNERHSAFFGASSRVGKGFFA